MSWHSTYAVMQAVATIAGGLISLSAIFHFAIMRPLRGFLRREIVAELVEIRKNLESVETKLLDHIAHHRYIKR